MEPDKFCCDIFGPLVDEAGIKGFSIIPISYQNTFKFFLQSRNKDSGDKEIESVFVAEMAISYCPWCGSNLSDVILANKTKISEIANRNKYLIMSAQLK
jgi:hypothetical protein